jgi:hypothetical protein
LSSQRKSGYIARHETDGHRRILQSASLDGKAEAYKAVSEIETEEGQP